MTDDQNRKPTEQEQPGCRFRTLPRRIRFDEMVEEVETEPARDPNFGHDPDRDWLLRNA